MFKFFFIDNFTHNRYAISDSNINDEHFGKLSSTDLPDVVLVKKHYPERRRRRNWHLKHLNENLFETENDMKYILIHLYLFV